MKGKVVHFEIPADDVNRAKKFYSDIFGWHMEAAPDMDYTLVSTTDVDKDGRPKEPGAINGGMLKRHKPVKHPVITIDVEDIEATLKEVEKMGGKVARKNMPVGDMGFAAYFTDPEGNLIGLWQSKMKRE